MTGYEDVLYTLEWWDRLPQNSGSCWFSWKAYPASGVSTWTEVPRWCHWNKTWFALATFVYIIHCAFLFAYKRGFFFFWRGWGLFWKDYNYSPCWFSFYGHSTQRHWRTTSGKLLRFLIDAEPALYWYDLEDVSIMKNFKECCLKTFTMEMIRIQYDWNTLCYKNKTYLVPNPRTSLMTTL